MDYPSKLDLGDLGMVSQDTLHSRRLCISSPSASLARALSIENLPLLLRMTVKFAARLRKGSHEYSCEDADDEGGTPTAGTEMFVSTATRFCRGSASAFQRSQRQGSSLGVSEFCRPATPLTEVTTQLQN